MQLDYIRLSRVSLRIPHMTKLSPKLAPPRDLHPLISRAPDSQDHFRVVMQCTDGSQQE